jgi:tripartite ATP-independent transporter DctM subunit
MVSLWIGVLMLVLLAAGIPVAFSLLVSGTIGLWIMGGWDFVFGILRTVPLSSVSSYELITVPMFLLMAEFVIASGVADSLFRAAAVWVGRVPGGLGIATAIAGACFGALSGSSTAGAATLASTSIPAMIKNQYEPRMASGVVAISGTLAMLIPPSIALVLYALVANVGVGKVLIAGIIPGLLVTLTIALTVLVLVFLDPSRAPVRERFSWREKFASLQVAGPVALLFLAVTGVIYLGVATPTEASGLGAFGAMLIAWRQGRLSWPVVLKALGRSSRTSCMIMAIILAAHVFGYFFTLTQAPQNLVKLIGGLEVAPWVILAMILVMYLILGCFLDQVTIIILTVPVVLPLVVSLGFDPVWFGVIVVVCAEVGMVTPPVGLNVFVVARYTGQRAEEIFAGVMPHVIAHIILIVTLVAWPQIILFLPAHMSQ